QALRLGADGNAARHNSAGVYLNDSLEASDAIVKAATLVASRRWKEAATLLQDTLVSAGDKLVRVAPGHYVGVREHITHILCGWPEEGQDTYRDLFERELIAELDKTLPDRSIGERFPEAAGTSTRRLLSLFDRYFCTSAAAELADTIGQLSIEAGDLALARHVYQRVVDGHPDRSTYTPKYQTMLALLGAMRGDAETSVPAAGDEVKLRWRGADRPLDDVLEEARRSFSALSRGTDPGDWPIFGGNTERSRRSESTIDELGLLWLTDLFKKPPEGAGDLGRGYHEDVGVGLSLSVQPVVHDELVFVQRQRELAAIHRNTGVVAWRFRADRVQGDVYEELDSRPPGWDSPTVHDGRVYVSLPGDVVPYYGYESPQSPPELVCLDASTGEVLWRSEREGLSERPSELGFDSSPIVDHGRLYVIGRRRRSFGFEDCYLYCLNAVDGRMLFRTHVGSASTGTFGARRPTPAVASLHEDMVYLCSNLGTITALSAYTGAVRWLRQYDRDVDAGSRGSGGREPPPWTFNPVFVSGDRLVAMPMDSSNVLVLAKDDGRNLDIIPVEEFAGIEMLFGMEGDVLCGVGAEVACYDVGDGALSWSAKLEAQERPLGRGVWAGEHLYVPAGTGVSMFEVSDGQRTDIAWSQGGRSGNLVALPGELFVAGADSLAVYVRKTELWNALRARMAASPSAPLPALELAEVALRGGEYAEATEVLDEAVRRADAFARAMEPSLRKRFFDDALMFAEVMNARSVLTPSVLDKLFTLAMQCAPDARGHVDYRFRFAKLYDQFHKPDRALPLYQQVLRDRSLRKIKIECPGAPPEIAEEAARVGIAELIARHGAAIYAPFEAEAKRWYARGLASANVELLARVADTFPNSDTAPLALIAQGELLAQMNRPDESARLLARAYHRYPEQVNRAQLIRKIADAYEQAGRPEHAY
ncbi:MAG: PQQ-binding-like beta-propeller repeat protein, partial [Phycisphaerae bacterium]